MQEVKDFYSTLKFPGVYSLDSLKFYDDNLVNRYLKIYDDSISKASSVLDIGCGSGFIVNFLARRHPNIKFDAIDFSDAIDYAREFSNNNSINNITYIKEDFLDWIPLQSYDVVICNGVLHHIPQYTTALQKLQSLTNSKVVIGIYNSYGKLFKNIFPVKYTNDVLYVDQEQCPFEVSFTDKQFKTMFNNFELLNVVPGYKNHFVDFYNLVNFANGGLTVYEFNLV
jgi:SAM-dependent methyltransferase